MLVVIFLLLLCLDVGWYSSERKPGGEKDDFILCDAKQICRKSFIKKKKRLVMMEFNIFTVELRMEITSKTIDASC